jgi:hypothetical protein
LIDRGFTGVLPKRKKDKKIDEKKKRLIEALLTLLRLLV